MEDKMKMRKYVAHNYDFSVGDITCFCMYGINKLGYLVVDYYMPKQGFSVLWGYSKDGKTLLLDLHETLDGRKTVCRFVVHPSYWSGKTLFDSHQTIYDAMNKLFAERLKYLEPEKYVKKVEVRLPNFG